MFKWIGAHIHDLVTYIRGGLYVQNLSSSVSTSALVVDANGQVGINSSLGGGGGGGGGNTESFVISDGGGGIITMKTANERKRSAFNGEFSTNYSINVSANDYQKTGFIVPKDSELKEIIVHTRGYDSGTYTGTLRVYRKNFTSGAAGTSTNIQSFSAVTLSGTTVLREHKLTSLSDVFNAGDEIYLTHQADTGYDNKRFVLVGVTYWFDVT